MLSLIKKPAKVDLLYNSNVFLVKDENALITPLNHFHLYISLEKLTHTNDDLLFTMIFDHHEFSPIRFFIIEQNSDYLNGITIPAADPNQSLIQYCNIVSENILKNYFISLHYNVYADESNPGYIVISAKLPGEKFRFTLSPINNNYPIILFASSGNTNPTYKGKGYHIKATFKVAGKEIVVTKRPDFFESKDSFSKFSAETVLERIVYKNRPVTATYPAPDANYLIPKYNPIISYDVSFTSVWNNNEHGLLPSNKHYLLAGGFPKEISNQIINNNVSPGQYIYGKFLTNFPSGSVTHKDAPIRLYFITGRDTPSLSNPMARVRTPIYKPMHRVRTRIYTNDGLYNVIFTPFVEIPQQSICEVIAGYKEQKLDLLFPNVKIASYDVSIINDEGALIAKPITFYPVHDHRYQLTSFLFINSFGVPDILNLTGSLTESEQLEVTRKSDYNPDNVKFKSEISLKGTVYSNLSLASSEDKDNIMNYFNDFSVSKNILLLRDGNSSHVQINSVSSEITQEHLFVAKIEFTQFGLKTGAPEIKDTFIMPPDVADPDINILLLEDLSGGILLESSDFVLLEN